MAELATIAGPTPRLFKAIAAPTTPSAGRPGGTLGRGRRHEQPRQFADNPKVSSRPGLRPDHGARPSTSWRRRKTTCCAGDRQRPPRGAAEIAAQFHALVNASSGVSDATVISAFAIDDGQLAEVAGRRWSSASGANSTPHVGRCVADRRHPRRGRRRGAGHLGQGRLEQMKCRLTRRLPRRPLSPWPHVLRRKPCNQSRRNFRTDQEPHRRPGASADIRTRAPWCPVTDGIVRIHGLSDVMVRRNARVPARQRPADLRPALNLERDSVGAGDPGRVRAHLRRRHRQVHRPHPGSAGRPRAGRPRGQRAADRRQRARSTPR